jgi:hypothetical protein
MKKYSMLVILMASLMIGTAVRTNACNCPGKEAGKKGATVTMSDPLAKPLLESYLAIRAALASDDIVGAGNAAEKLSTALDKGIIAARKDKRCESYMAGLEDLSVAAKRMTDKKPDIEGVREKFAALSDEFIKYIGENVATGDAKAYQLYYCGMAKHYWLQKADEKIGNPYYGTAMPGCGEKKAMPDSTTVKCPGCSRKKCDSGKINENNKDKAIKEKTNSHESK